jgi:hypothetical protein
MIYGRDMEVERHYRLLLAYQLNFFTFSPDCGPVPLLTVMELAYVHTVY